MFVKDQGGGLRFLPGPMVYPPVNSYKKFLDDSSTTRYLARMIEFCQTPINESQSSVLMIDHDIMRLHIPVHDSHAVAVIQSSQQLV